VTLRLPRNVDAITRGEAAVLLGIGEDAVGRLRREGLLTKALGGRQLYSRSEVQALIEDPWLNGVQAAAVLGVSHVRVSQLATADRIPFRLTRSGKRVYRQSQLAVVANARQAKLGRFPSLEPSKE
jgi:hypothetical protein